MLEKKNNLIKTSKQSNLIETVDLIKTVDLIEI